MVIMVKARSPHQNCPQHMAVRAPTTHVAWSRTRLRWRSRKRRSAPKAAMVSRPCTVSEKCVLIGDAAALSSRRQSRLEMRASSKTYQ